MYAATGRALFSVSLLVVTMFALFQRSLAFTKGQRCLWRAPSLPRAALCSLSRPSALVRTGHSPSLAIPKRYLARVRLFQRIKPSQTYEDPEDPETHDEKPLAPVTIRNTQRQYPLDLKSIREDLDIIRSILHVRDFSVDLWFCSEKKIRELNGRDRGKQYSTDVLSYAYHDFKVPEQFRRKPHMGEKVLGDIIIAPAFVARQCEQDKVDFGHEPTPITEEVPSSSSSDEPMSCEAQSALKAESESDEKDEDRGVSGAMTRVFTVQERVPMLLIHSLLHLLGHDHEQDDEWALMVQREEEVLAEYQRRKRVSAQPQVDSASNLSS